MSLHIAAKPEDVAPTALLSGDPLRAKWVAENFLTEVSCYTTVRNMLGFTGITAGGNRVSVQGSGMGMPSLGIYVNELIKSYGVKRIIRIGSAGSLQLYVHCRQIVLAMASCSDSALNARRFDGMSFAPTASWPLLEETCYAARRRKGIKVHVGNIFATDKFYDDVPDSAWEIFARYGVLAIEMETAELYTLAAQAGIEALSILTISDHLVTHQSLSAAERETSFYEMAELALDQCLPPE